MQTQDQRDVVTDLTANARALSATSAPALVDPARGLERDVLRDLTRRTAWRTA